METISSLRQPVRLPWLALAALALGVIFDVLFQGHTPGISFPLFWLAALIVVVLFDRIGHRHMTWNEVVVSVFLLVLSVFPAVYDSRFLYGLDLIAVVYLFFLLLAHLFGAPTRQYRFSDYLLFPFWDIFVSWLQRLDAFPALAKENFFARPKIVWKAILLTLLSLTVFGALFVSADLVLQKVLRDLTSSLDVWQMFQRVFLTALVAFVTFPILAAAFWKKHTSRLIQDAPSARTMGLEIKVALAVSTILFAAFIGFQIVYLFGGKANLEAFDLTYATYARAGFFQLLVVALIVLGLIYGLRRRFPVQDHWSKTLQVTFLLLTCVILASSWFRLSLYEEAFGFTNLRLFSHYFLLIVAMTLVIFAYSVAFKTRESLIFRSVVFLFAIGLIGLNLINPDLFIAEKNIERMRSGHGLDVPYLASLSDDAAPVIADYFEERLFSVPSSELLWPGEAGFQDPYGEYIQWLDQKEITAWQSWNAARSRAVSLRSAERRVAEAGTLGKLYRYAAKAPIEIGVSDFSFRGCAVLHGHPEGAIEDWKTLSARGRQSLLNTFDAVSDIFGKSGREDNRWVWGSKIVRIDYSSNPILVSDEMYLVACSCEDFRQMEEIVKREGVGFTDVLWYAQDPVNLTSDPLYACMGEKFSPANFR